MRTSQGQNDLIDPPESGRSAADCVQPAGAEPGRRHLPALVALGAAAVIAAVLLWPTGGDSGRQPTQPQDLAVAEDALHRRTVSELRVFTDWLAEHDEQGYIGEVGWPADQDADRWTRLAERWFEEAETAGLRVDLWATGEWWGLDYSLSAYVASTGGAVDTTRAQGDLLSRQAEDSDHRRGVSVAGAEFGAPGSTERESSFSNRNPGIVDEAYHYDSQETFDYLADRGLDGVRLPFRWERIQPELGAPLNLAELARLEEAVARADRAGLEVVLDLHNYGSYFFADGDRGVRRAIGSQELTSGHLADLWRRLSEAFRDVPGVSAYGLMNEPADLPAVGGMDSAQVWERASQEALLAVRSTGDTTLVAVAGYGWSHTRDWPEHHPVPWIEDPADNIVYEAHHYWQREYDRSYDEELADAVEAGF